MERGAGWPGGCGQEELGELFREGNEADFRVRGYEPYEVAGADRSIILGDHDTNVCVLGRFGTIL